MLRFALLYLIHENIRDEKSTVAKWANVFMISWAHTQGLVTNASGRVESFPMFKITYLPGKIAWFVSHIPLIIVAAAKQAPQ